MKQRLLYLDAVRGVAALMVVMGHVLFFVDDDTIPLHSYANEFIISVHMPIFVMIAGFLSQKRIKSISETLYYWRDKFIRLILPLVFLYPLLTLWRDNHIHYDGIHLHFYWFTFNLFCYFILFFIQRWLADQILSLVKRSDNKYWECGMHLIATLLIYYVFASLLPELYKPAGEILVMTRMRFIWLYPYLILGFIVGRLSIIEYFRSHLSGAIAVILIFLSFIGMHYLPVHYTDNMHLIGNIYRIIAPAFTALLIYIFTHLEKQYSWIERIFVFLGRWSLPIYFIHFFFLPVFPGLRIWLGGITDFVRLGVDLFIILAGAIFTLIPTLVVIFSIKLNPYLDFFLCGEKQRLLKK